MTNTKTMETKSELIARLVKDFKEKGDDDSFRALYDETDSQIRKFLKTKFRDAPDMVDDIMQEIYLAIWEKGLGVKSDERYPAYMKSAGFFKGLDIAARESRLVHSTKEMMENGDPMEMIPDMSPETDPVRMAESDEITRRVRARVAKLSKPMRETYRLYFEKNLTMRKISERLGISEGTVKSRISAIRAVLRPGLEEFRDNTDMGVGGPTPFDFFGNPAGRGRSAYAA